MMGAWLAGHLKNWLAPDTTGLWRVGRPARRRLRLVGRLVLRDPEEGANKDDGLGVRQVHDPEQRHAARARFAVGRRLPGAARSAERRASSTSRSSSSAASRRACCGARSRPKIPAIAVDQARPGGRRDVIAAEFDKVLEQGKDIKTALADAQGPDRAARAPLTAVVRCSRDPTELHERRHDLAWPSTAHPTACRCRPSAAPATRAASSLAWAPYLFIARSSCCSRCSGCSRCCSRSYLSFHQWDADAGLAAMQLGRLRELSRSRSPTPWFRKSLWNTFWLGARVGRAAAPGGAAARLLHPHRASSAGATP